MIVNIEYIAKNAIDILLEDAVNLTEDRAQPIGVVQLEKSIDNLIKKIYDKTKTTDEKLKTKFWNVDHYHIDIDLTAVKNKINIDDFNANLDIYMHNMLSKLGYYTQYGEDKKFHRTYFLDPYYPKRVDISNIRYLYHSTPKENARKIAKQGLIPSKKPEMGYTPRIYVGSSPTSYGDVLFRIDTSKLRKGTKFYLHGAGYITYTHIPPEALTIIKSDLNESSLLETVAEDNINRAAKVLYNAKQDKDIAKELAKIDQTVDKSYLQWLVKIFLNGSMLLPGDADRAKEALDFFDKNKRKATWIYLKDILKYNKLQDLESVVDALSGVDLKKLRSRSDVIPGAEEVYNDGIYQVLRINTIEALEYYSIDTRWCTKKERDKARDYIPYTDMYVMLKSGYKLYMYSFGKSMWHTKGFEFKDIEDEEAWGKATTKEKSIVRSLFNVYKNNKFDDGLISFVGQTGINSGQDFAEKYERNYFAKGIPIQIPLMKLTAAGEEKLKKLNPALAFEYALKHGKDILEDSDLDVFYDDGKFKFVEITNNDKLTAILKYFHILSSSSDLSHVLKSGAVFFVLEGHKIIALLRLADMRLVDTNNEDLKKSNLTLFEKVTDIMIGVFDLEEDKKKIKKMQEQSDLTEGLEEKMPYLIKFLAPQEQQDLDSAKQKVRAISQADPTQNKMYTGWLVKQVINKQVELPNDKEDILKVLAYFNKKQQKFEKKDINQYKSFDDLKKVIIDFVKAEKELSGKGEYIINTLKATGRRGFQDQHILDQYVNWFLAMDPSSDKKYIEWILQEYKKGGFKPPEDIAKVKDLIKYYDENKGYFRHSNITNYDYDRLTNEYMELTKQEFGKFEFKEMDGAELVYDDGIWKAIYLTNVKAVMFYAKGTKWCVTAESNARSYLGYGNLMIFAKRDKKVALMCLGSNDLKNAADLDLQTNNPDMFEFVKKIMEEVFVTDDDEKKK